MLNDIPAFQCTQNHRGSWDIFSTVDEVTIEVIADKWDAIARVTMLNRIARGEPYIRVRHVTVENADGQSLEGWILADPELDLDATFTLIEDGTGERLKVNGCNATVESSAP